MKQQSLFAEDELAPKRCVPNPQHVRNSLKDLLEQMRAALKAAGNPSEIVVYPEAGHGFNADYRPGYNKEAAQDGWKRLQQWFKKYGAA